MQVSGNKNIFLVCIVCLFVLTSSPAMGEASTENLQNSNSQFQVIQQPLAIKVAVSIGGLGLIGLELWWFTYRKNL